MRAGKLDSAWVKAVWVGPVHRPDEQLLLTTKGYIRSRVVRRIPDGNQASYHAEVEGLPWDTLKGSAEMFEECDGQAGVNHQDHREEGFGRTGLQHKQGQRPPQDDKKQHVMIKYQAVQMTICGS